MSSLLLKPMFFLNVIFLFFFTYSNAADIQINWQKQSYDSIDANEGDTLTFIFDNGFDVYKLPSEKEFQNCEFGNFIGGKTSSPVVFIVEANKGGNPLFFACGIDDYCSQSDMKISVNVGVATTHDDDAGGSNDDDDNRAEVPLTDAPTLQPTRSPRTRSPTSKPSSSGGGPTTNEPFPSPTAAFPPIPTSNPSTHPTLRPSPPPTALWKDSLSYSFSFSYSHQ
jgi:hypothetical protein